MEQGSSTLGARLLLLLAFATAATAQQLLRQCSDCDAGWTCGMCLNLVSYLHCPSGRQPDQLETCESPLIGQACEGDGECATDEHADNCVGWFRHGTRSARARTQHAQRNGAPSTRASSLTADRCASLLQAPSGVPTMYTCARNAPDRPTR